MIGSLINGGKPRSAEKVLSHSLQWLHLILFVICYTLFSIYKENGGIVWLLIGVVYVFGAGMFHRSLFIVKNMPIEYRKNLDYWPDVSKNSELISYQLSELEKSFLFFVITDFVVAIIMIKIFSIFF
jgi:hypothetical protein